MVWFRRVWKHEDIQFYIIFITKKSLTFKIYFSQMLMNCLIYITINCEYKSEYKRPDIRDNLV